MQRTYSESVKCWTNIIVVSVDFIVIIIQALEASEVPLSECSYVNLALVICFTVEVSLVRQSLESDFV